MKAIELPAGLPDMSAWKGIRWATFFTSDLLLVHASMGTRTHARTHMNFVREAIHQPNCVVCGENSDFFVSRCGSDRNNYNKNTVAIRPTIVHLNFMLSATTSITSGTMQVEAVLVRRE